MANVIIVHGVQGYPEENWFPWLKSELENLGHTVFVPKFPTPENQTLSNWLDVMESYKKFFNAKTIVVGHSLGVAFLLSLIEQLNEFIGVNQGKILQIKAAFFVAGFVGKIGNRFDDSMKSFAQKTFEWERIRKNCQNFFVFHSDNDPYVSLKKAQELAAFLQTEAILVPDGGHFNTAAGFARFDQLLKMIRPMLSNGEL